MSYAYEQGRKKLQELCDWFKGNHAQRNEATTRLRMVDTIFFDCLGWSKDDVILEDSWENKYTDYTFLAPRKMLIVEAKKEGEYFELPAGVNRASYSLSSLMRDYKTLKQAIEQVAQYCQSRGTPYAVVCNGHQIVSFVAARNDGINPFEGKAVVFHSLEFMVGNFLFLWQALSKAGIEEKNLQRLLVGNSLADIPPKLSSKILQYPGIKNRNIVQTDLQILGDLIIEDIIRSPELEEMFLKECYCISGALSQYALISKNILKDRYAALFDSSSPGPALVPATTREGVSSELMAQSFSHRPILLIGDVGSGKSIFIRNLISVEGKAIFKDAISFYLDFGSKATLTQDLRKFIIQDIKKQLLQEQKIDIDQENFVRGIYHSELSRFKRGIYGKLAEENPQDFLRKEIEFLEAKLKDEESHLKMAIEHIAKAHKKQIVVFFDNADQRDDDTQQQVFLIAQELAEHWSVAIFVTLRPETFHSSLRVGALSGYHPKAFTVSPPRVDQVIGKRLSFALKICRGEIPVKILGDNTRVKLLTLEIFISALIESLQNDGELAEFIDNIPGGNIRLALELIKAFLGSGHVDTQKIIEISQKTGRYLIPLHEFLRAVIFGDEEYYDPSRSPIANLFDVSTIDPKEHFILPILLSMLIGLGDTGQGAGFVETNKIYEKLQGLSYSPEQIDNAIIRGFRAKLIETAARKTPKKEKTMPLSIRGTTIGAYYVSKLCRLFTYFDAIVVDTPIIEESFRKEIGVVDEIMLRLSRGEQFCNYFDKQWELLKDKGTTFDWDMVSRDVKVKIEAIRQKLSQKINKDAFDLPQS